LTKADSTLRGLGLLPPGIPNLLAGQTLERNFIPAYGDESPKAQSKQTAAAPQAAARRASSSSQVSGQTEVRSPAVDTFRSKAQSHRAG